MPIQLARAVTNRSSDVRDRVLAGWQSLDRGWKAALFGLAIVFGHLVPPFY